MTRCRTFSNVIGFDDAPFSRSYRGNVCIIGAVYAGLRFDGVLQGYIRRDGANAAKTITKLVEESRFAEHAQLIMLQGITMGGFNVVDIHYINRHLQVPVLVVARNKPDITAIKESLVTKISGGLKKWKIIEKVGLMEPVSGVFVQTAGLTIDEANQVIKKFAIYGNIPEPLRTAHLIAGGIIRGHSRGRV